MKGEDVKVVDAMTLKPLNSRFRRNRLMCHEWLSCDWR